MIPQVAGIWPWKHQIRYSVWMLFFLICHSNLQPKQGIIIMIWIWYGMMLDILINIKIDGFYWVDGLNPINSQEPVLQMVAIPLSYFRIVGGGGQKKFMKTCIFHVYRIESKYGFQLVHRCIWQKLQYIVGFEVLQTTLWARCWSIGNANCLENIFAPKNLNLGTEEHMCPIYTLCNNFLTQFPKHLCFNMTTTILKTHLILKTTYSVSMPYPIVA